MTAIRSASASASSRLWGGEHHRAAHRPQLPDLLPQTAARLDVESGRRLVQKDQLRVAGQREREHHPLLLPPGEPAVAPLAQLLETGHCEQPGDRERRRIIAAEQLQVLGDGEGVGNTGDLQHGAAAQPDRLRSGRLPEHARHSFLHPQAAQEQPDPRWSCRRRSGRARPAPRRTGSPDPVRRARRRRRSDGSHSTVSPRTRPTYSVLSQTSVATPAHDRYESGDSPITSPRDRRPACSMCCPWATVGCL